jgi:hypothetical protein
MSVPVSVRVIAIDSKVSLTGGVMGWRRCGAQACVVVGSGLAHQMLA